MTREITVSEDVYRRLKQESGDRSFSEVINEALDANEKLSDVTGEEVLDPNVHREVKSAIERSSGGTLDRVDEETD